MTNSQIAARTVRLILGDLTDRSGLQNAWDDIDGATQREIKRTWASFIEKALDVYSASQGKRADEVKP